MTDRALSVVVRRRGVVEARHAVHAVAVQNGRVVASAGDAGLVCYLRSSAKPLQALPLARAREDMDERDLAIASASHLGDESQIAAVRGLLAKAPAGETHLECGLEDGRPPEAIYHNCSGKHAGMLALCRARGWESRGYRRAEHPLQRTMLAEVAVAAQVRPEVIPTAIDGCGVVTFALPLERMAAIFSRLLEFDGGPRVSDAMRAHPELIRGGEATDTRLMQLLAGWAAKGGAEGLLCASGPAGLGVALKVADGSGRALSPAVAAFLATIGEPVEELAVLPVRNSRGERVGELVIEP
jgi:L-asparaginase II